MYKPGECLYRYASFGKRDGQQVTLKTLFKRAHEAGWRWQDESTASSRSRAEKHDTKPASSLKTLAEVLNRQVQHDWQISDYIERRQTVVLFGESGTWKSLLGIDMTCCIGYGLRWRGHKTAPGAVLYIAGEGGGGGLTRRLKAWHIVNRPPDQETPIFFREAATWLPDDLWALIEEVTEFLKERGWNLELVILDTLARTMTGNQNSQEDFSKCQQAVDTLRDTFDCTVMIIHHSGHGDKSRPKGAYEIIGNPDVILQMEKLDEKHCKLIARKVKDAETPQDMVFQLAPAELGEVNEEGKPITSVVLRHLSDRDNPPSVEQAPNKYWSVGKHEKEALRVLKRLVRQQHKNLDESGHPEGIPRVKEDDWRVEFCGTFPKNTPASTCRSAFFRVRRNLAEHHHITVENGFVSLEE